MGRNPRPNHVIHVDTGKAYRVFFTSLGNISDLLLSLQPEVQRCIVITDENVGPLYGDALTESLEAAGLSAATITLPAGESTKSIEHLLDIYDSALSWGIERDTLVLSLGGGVVGDLAGFAAATLLRGLPLVQIPTTLVAQVDSSIGGKTGINHPLGKNLIGAFYQPLAVAVDTSTLQSLPEREWTSGLAEVVKHGLIDDEGLVELLESNWGAVSARESDVLGELLPRAARVKARIVTEDERETGRRVILNFGHTFAHAIEKVTGYGTYTHGEAVAAGMRAAIHLSKTMHPDLDSARADEIVARIPVPSGLSELEIPELMDAMRLDKKVQRGRIRVVLLRRIGDAYATADINRSDIEASWRFLQETTD